jgi:carboxypeptidase family protein
MSGIICGRVADKGSKVPVVNATVSLHSASPCVDGNRLQSTLTNEEGKFEFANLEEKTYCAQSSFLGKLATAEGLEVRNGQTDRIELGLDLDLSVTLHAFIGKGDDVEPCSHAIAGHRFLVRLEAPKEVQSNIAKYDFIASPDGTIVATPTPNEAEITFAGPGIKRIEIKAYDKNYDKDAAVASKRIPYALSSIQTHASESDRQMIGGNIGVRLERTRVHPTRDQALWIAIRNRTGAIGFARYQHFINRVLQAEEREKLDNPRLERKLKELGTNLHGVGAYEVLKLATEAFLLLECGIRIEEEQDERRHFFHPEFESALVGEPVSFEYAQAKLREYLGSPQQLPYITRVIAAAFPEWREGTVCCDRVLTGRVNEPCLIELIWSYWHEEGMLAQTMNAVTRRFQNVRAPGDRDPIAHLEIDPLRPLNNLIWGAIQDEFQHLSVKRRAYEYEHQYGLTLYGKAVREMRPADSRSKFLEAFHNLLHLCSVFFKEDNDTTVIADGYPLLNALKEVHLLLAQGAHNQFGDLPWTARAEMMLQQWMLARPEIRDFLQSRAMVPYKEAWMPQVDTMKTLQGWSDVTVTHFRDLAVYGEQILLSVRYGDWIAIVDEDSAKNWARYWRPEIQGYLHAYRAATGIDLTNPDTVDSTVPAVLLQKRLVLQQQRAR